LGKSIKPKNIFRRHDTTLQQEPLESGQASIAKSSTERAACAWHRCKPTSTMQAKVILCTVSRAQTKASQHNTVGIAAVPAQHSRIAVKTAI
jgi:hypothetical protein